MLGRAGGEGSPMMSLLGRLAAVAVGHFGAGFQCTCPWANGVPSGQLPFASPPPRRPPPVEREGRGICRCSGRVRSNPSHFPIVHFLSVKGCQDVSGVETRETPASWEASVAASSMARDSIYTLSTLNHANQDASVHSTRSLSNPTANGLLKIDDWQLKAIAHHPVVPHFQCSGPVSTLQRPGKSGTSGTPLSPPPPQTVCGCVVGLDHARCRSVRKKNGARPRGNVQNKTATCPSRKKQQTTRRVTPEPLEVNHCRTPGSILWRLPAGGTRPASGSLGNSPQFSLHHG